jgi:FAD/FMN-containing dehydrogenase
LNKKKIDWQYPDGLLNALTARFDQLSVLRGDEVTERSAGSWGPPRKIVSDLLVRPADPAGVADVLAICERYRQPVVTHGGLTGIVDGAWARPGDLVLSLERLNVIEDLDTAGRTMTVQAGVQLQKIQEAAAAEQLMFPLDLGARGSATIGGATATNAGGLNVLRYGMLRNLILGLEAVLADGTVISSMNQMLKNNTGYDVKQLFIGSEGTLGIVTRVVVRLFPLSTSRQTAMLALDSFDAVVETLQAMRSGLAGTLSAFEVMWNNYYAAMTTSGEHAPPLGPDHAYYVLAEAEGSNPESDDERFEALLERGLASGTIADAVLPKSNAERATLWAIREEFEPLLPAYLYDVSLPIAAMTTYVERLGTAMADWRGDAMAFVFGHIADGNLHIFVTPHDDGAHHDVVDAAVYGSLEGLSGSVSAEHGIGKEKVAWLASSRSPEEIQLMRSLKKVLDPHNLLNPGNILG